MRTLALVGLAALAFSSALATIDYKVSLAPGAEVIQVQMTIPTEGKDVKVQIPNWAPGSYRLVRYFDSIVGAKAVGAGNAELKVTKPDDNTWHISASNNKSVTFSYGVKVPKVGDVLHYAGPGVYMYVVDRKTEPATLTFAIPENWRAICGLDGAGKWYTAPDYDVLADNPVTVGVFETDTYTAAGVHHTIAYFGGDVSSVDRKQTLEYCRFVSESQAKFWGGLPMRKYVWHFTVMNSNDGGWGLEHLSSTTMGIARGLGPGTVSVMSHEYFHAWNVKRIRSKALGPFNYLELPKTGHLWWLEGVTDYYADLILYRYGQFGDDYFASNILSNLQRTRSNQQRFEVSPYDSSYRVGEAANGRGNSSGFGVNYYNTGWLVGFCLDAELRSVTGGKYSLDDVCHALWDICKDDQPGFEEDEIRKQLVRLGGSRMGEVYDEWVMKPGELPVEAQAAKLGLRVASVAEKYADPGFTATMGQGGPVVTRVAEGSPVAARDVLLQVGSVNLESLSGRELMSALNGLQSSYKVGEPVKVKVKRGEETVELTVMPKEGTRNVMKVDAINDANAETVNRWSEWSGRPVSAFPRN
ncbi:hypothetical protein QPK87_09935 [Kamptonema cortianum]|nr:hypothetical protein [Geitlerinema splendidum]MDK3156895.1 hypothetical protein [Kamptonema cortianum]